MKSFLIFLFLFSSYRLPAEVQKNSDTSYREFPLIMHRANASIYGTLTLPETATRKLTVCLIIAGSGPTDRNGNNPAMKNESLKLFAHALADSGIASLRYDKRGIGESAIPNMIESDLRFEDYVNDAIGWVEELKKDKRFNRIIIAGHSEGSLIGMISSQKNVDGFISLAGAGIPAGQLIANQISLQAPTLADEAKSVIDSLEAGNTVSKVNPMLSGIFRTSVQPYLISWFRYDPAVEMAKLSIPVLIIQGEADLQVHTEDANKLFAASKSGKEQIIPEMNHILKKVTAENADNMASYNNPDRPLHPKLMRPIVSFIRSLP